MMTSRSLFAAVAMSTVVTIFAGPPASALADTGARTPAAATSTSAAGRILGQIAQVKATVATNARDLSRARTQASAAADRGRRWAAQLRADVANRDRLVGTLNRGIAELYISQRAETDPHSIIGQFRALKARIATETTNLSRAHREMLSASAAAAHDAAKLAAATARLARLQAAARRLGIQDPAPASRVRVRVTRGARGYICPVGGPVRFTDDFGEPRPTGRHTGIDMLAETGIPVLAVFAGTIIPTPQGYENSGYGNLQVLRDNAGHEWWYAHLSAKLVRPGTAVVPGQVIGRVGCSGRCSGSHLHFEFRPRPDTPADPYGYLTAAC
jgi:murein DD-endopeptidase MepM/ murein hydrolase activator NlpD